jgi:hypothetical protein
MINYLKLPRALSKEPNPPKPRRPSHATVIQNLDRWANSGELQPPRSPSEDGMISFGYRPDAPNRLAGD